MDQSTSISENPEVYLAGQYAQHTHQSIFLTGKAGTGKTTFLRDLRATSHKKMAVAAPTGIAAINANGVTLHSLFQLPFGTFLPDAGQLSGDGTFYNREFLLRNTRFSADKRRLLQELELLIIDEVSMLRCDLLDAIDTILRSVRKNKNPFGQLQVLFIGDLQQLPPVVQDREWEKMSAYYQTPFFFSAHAYHHLKPVYIELKKIYRQSESTFIGLLENVRRNQLTPSDMELLNSRLNPGKPTEEGEVTLTTHNSKADTINQKQLHELKGDAYEFNGILTGDFNEKNLPTEMKLVLKKGAQVMFIKNDSSSEKRYYNGCMAVVKEVDQKSIKVEIPGLEEPVTLVRESWTNVKYSHNLENDKIEEEETGSFSQFPVKLAWAITIHKSQGLTFDKLRIDAADAFAAGQVYVALSRCRTLDGITLTSPVSRGAVQTDKRLDSELLAERENEHLMQELAEAKKVFARFQLKVAFSFEKDIENLQAFKSFVEEKTFGDKESSVTVLDILLEKLKEIRTTGDKFIYQLEAFFYSGKDDDLWLQERIGKAITYFAQQLNQELVKPLDKMFENLSPKKGTKQVCKKLFATKESIWAKVLRIQSVEFSSFDFSAFHKPIQREVNVEAEKKKTGKAVKGETYTETLRYFEEGKTMAEIAEVRGMAVSTVEGHMARFVSSGEVPLNELLEPTAIKSISLALDKFPEDTVTALREKLGGTYSYGQIRLVMAKREADKSVA